MPRLSAPPKAAESPPPDQAELPPPAKKAAAPKATRATTAAPPGGDEFGFYALDEDVDYVNALLYGREGSGKTTAAAHLTNLPGVKRVLVCRAEGGLKKVALQAQGVDTSKIVLWPAPGLRVTFRSLEQLHEKLLADLMADPNSWGGFVMDSLSEVVQTLREQATSKRNEKLARTLTAAELAEVEDFVDRDDYGVMTNQLRQLIRRFRDLPCHVVLTALERVDDKTGVVGPAISPALASDVMGYMDVVLAMRASLHAAGEDDDTPLAEYRALTKPGKSTRAKDRYGTLPRVLANPSFTRLHSYVTGNLAEDADPVQAAFNQRRAEEAAALAATEAEREAAKAAKKAPAKKATTPTESKEK